MPSTQTTPIVKILLDLGIDLDNLSSDEDYLSELLEGHSIITFSSKGKGDKRSDILGKEIVRVRKERKKANPSPAMKKTIQAKKKVIKADDIKRGGATGAAENIGKEVKPNNTVTCLLYTSPSKRDRTRQRMPSSA